MSSARMSLTAIRLGRDSRVGRGDACLLASVGSRSHATTPGAGARWAPLGADADAVDLRADRGDRRGADDIAPRAGSAGERNWDYRHTWIRDAAVLALCALAPGLWRGGRCLHGFAKRAVSRLAASANRGHCKLMYGLDGRTELPEELLTHLEGYRGSAPVRIGNGARQPAAARHPTERLIGLGLPL